MAASEFDRRRLTLDCIFGVITQTEAAEQLGISVQRMSQLVAKMRRQAGGRTPQEMAHFLAERDPRNAVVWRFTPKHMYYEMESERIPIRWI